MKKFFHKFREFITLFAYVAIVATLFWGVIKPLFSRINSIRDQIQETQIKQQSDREHINELPKMQKQYEFIEKNHGSIDVLLDKNAAVALIERLEKIADDSGNKISITVQDTQVPKNAAAKAKNAADNTLINSLPSSNYLQFKITLDGGYNSIVKFINALENFSYYSDIVAIQIRDNVEDSAKQNSNGISNPFVSAQASVDAKPQSGQDGMLEATLDVVFYTK